MTMFSCESLFWCGIAVMGTAVFGMILGAVGFFLSGRSLKRKLYEEYGEPYK